MPPLLSIKGLVVATGGGARLVDGVDFEVAKGRTLGLIGESGSGKTTIALAAMGYVRAGCHFLAGSVRLNGREILTLPLRDRQALRSREVAYVAQSAAAAFNPAMTIDAQVTEVAVMTGLMTRSEALDRARALYAALDLPGPDNIGRRYPHQLSGGQLQRLMAAMAMIARPALLILDEPTTALDVTTQIEVLDAFRRLIRDTGTATLYVSHDLAMMAQIADEVLVIRAGQAVERGPTDEILNRPRAPYSRALVAAARVLPKAIAAPALRVAPPAPLLAVERVTAAYGPRREAVALRDVSLAVAPGETVGLIGESGSGKTTLGRVIAGLMAPTAGRVLLDGRSLAPCVGDRPRPLQQQVQFVFQMADVALNPRHSVGNILSRPMRFYRDLSAREAMGEVAELLERVELAPEIAGRLPSELSGGQRQRVNLARAIAARPRLVVCDEITSALDTIVARQILALLNRLQDEFGLAYIFITHDLATLTRASRVAVMREGRIVEEGPVDSVLTAPSHQYTQLLLASVPEMRCDWLDGAVTVRRALLSELEGGEGPPAPSDLVGR